MAAAAKSLLRICNPPPHRPKYQYALMLDAGSTGSRIHVYKFNYCNGNEQAVLESEIFMQVKPGLSSFPDDPKAAADSLNPLLQRGLSEIPIEYQKCTPIALKATAGLRLLGAIKSNKILDMIRAQLVETYPFPIADNIKGTNDGISIMEGSEEGVFAWITVNYLTRKIGQSKKVQTAGIMDLGGGSTQIVFEPTANTVVPVHSDYRYDLTFGGHQYVLYQHSYLGYGLMEARKRLKAAAAAAAVDPLQSLPCLYNGDTMKKAGATANTNAARESSLEFAKCHAFISQHLFDKKAKCTVNPCSFDGVHQPKDISKGSGDLYAFSYFYDKTQPHGLIDSFSINDILKLGEKVCAGAAAKTADGLDTNDEDSAHMCLDIGFIYGLLATGYELPAQRQLKVLKKIDDFETGWCLGAAIQMIDSLIHADSKLVCKAGE